MTGGAVLLAAGLGLWAATGLVPPASPALAAFVVLTVMGERLELTAFTPRPRGAVRRVGAAAAIAGVGALLAGVRPEWFDIRASGRVEWPAAVGWCLWGLGTAGLGAWMLRHDLARRNLRRRPADADDGSDTGGLRRYAGWAMQAGHAWALVGGVIALVAGALAVAAAGGWRQAAPGWSWEALQAGPAYDAVLHALLLGFAFSMIFGHAPTVLPAVIGRPLPFRPVLWVPLVLLHAGVAGRVGLDAFAALALARGREAPDFIAAGIRHAALLHVAAIVLFAVTALIASVRESRRLRADTRPTDRRREA